MSTVQKAIEVLCNRDINSVEYTTGRDLLDHINELEAKLQALREALEQAAFRFDVLELASNLDREEFDYIGEAQACRAAIEASK